MRKKNYKKRSKKSNKINLIEKKKAKNEKKKNFQKNIYRNCVIARPPPPQTHFKSFRRVWSFEFEWVVFRAKHDERFYPVNQENQKKISDLKKSFRRVYPIWVWGGGSGNYTITVRSFWEKKLKRKAKYFCGKKFGKKNWKKKYFGNIFFLVFTREGWIIRQIRVFIFFFWFCHSCEVKVIFDADMKIINAPMLFLMEKGVLLMEL